MRGERARSLLELEAVNAEYRQLETEVTMLREYKVELGQRLEEKDHALRREKELARRRMGEEAARLLVEKRRLEAPVGRGEGRAESE